MGYFPLKAKEATSSITATVASKIIVGTLCFLIIMVCMAYPSGAVEQRTKNDRFSSLAAAETCVPLLESLYQSPPNDVAARNQHSAGKLAAFGLALGMRYALQPSGQDSASILQTVSTETESKAMEIIRYRHCIKQNALQSAAINNTRKFAALD